MQRHKLAKATLSRRTSGKSPSTLPDTLDSRCVLERLRGARAGFVLRAWIYRMALTCLR